MKDLIANRTRKQIEENCNKPVDLYADLFPNRNKKEEAVQLESIAKESIKPENIAKGILYRACSHAGQDLGLNSDYMYNRIIKEQGIDWA